MAISGKLKQFLEASKVRYSVAKHPVAYTAQEIAAAQHVPGRQLAKSVLVNTDQGPVLAVLPAVSLIHSKQLRTLLGAKKVSIAKESDIKARFPDVEIGAMSPFGNLYDVPVVVDRGLGEADEMVFNAGSHADTITMRYADFVALVKPKTGAFGQPFGGQAPAKKPSKSSAKPSKAAPPRGRSNSKTAAHDRTTKTRMTSRRKTAKTRRR